MATLSELQAELTQVEAAITRIETAGQSFQGPGGRQKYEVTYFRLLDRRAHLERRIAFLSNDSKLHASRPVFGGSGV